MPFTLTMPKLSPTMETGTIVKWHKAVGQHVEAGDLLLEAATDKATVEYNALDSGWLRQILVEDGGEAVVNQAIAILTEEKEESIEGYQPTGSAPAPAPQAEIDEQEPAEERPASPSKAPSKTAAAFKPPAFTPEPPLEDYDLKMHAVPLAVRVKASPLAKKLAKEKGLDLTTIKGSGPRDRIVSRDLERAQPGGQFAFGRKELPQTVPGSYEEEALSPMRKVIAQRLQEAKTFIPHFYVSMKVNAQPMVALREQLKNLQLKVTFNDLIVRATALALRKHPDVNSGFDSSSTRIIRFKTIDIAVAVSLESGLITPIVRHADFKNLGELSIEIKNLAARAKAGKLESHEYKGGSFTISNLGMYGVSEFIPIINPPQAAILAVSGIQEVAVVRNGQLVPGSELCLTLAGDHRVIDGAAGAQFLQTLKGYVENPASLLL
jgi:pyruvate dehydrogenase E2 component (dihydrolipoamide acetyltransferase)